MASGKNLPEENTSKGDEKTDDNGRPGLSWHALWLLKHEPHGASIDMRRLKRDIDWRRHNAGIAGETGGAFYVPEQGKTGLHCSIGQTNRHGPQNIPPSPRMNLIRSASHNLFFLTSWPKSNPCNLGGGDHSWRLVDGHPHAGPHPAHEA